MTERDPDLTALFCDEPPSPPDETFVAGVSDRLRTRRWRLAIGAAFALLLSATAVIALVSGLSLAGGPNGAAPPTWAWLAAGICVAALCALSPRIFRELRS